ncbi:hypothetical protein EGT74_18385 [Chitinophaga lutea]|uniref:Uncharacterized protein n=1 Tax=Chitinophaga lutea TaxID=2488634 RepID=A0A3N4PV73_9BACT|nr:hypothetical protein [Chitinophaga lutea]RPE08981.1 hypothetical protein EGT74_18385 [Chitinophaga lutea]
MKTIKPYLITLPALVIPFLFLQGPNPFHLTGPAFLHFYLTLLLATHTAVFLLRRYVKGKQATPFTGCLMGITLFTGLARLVQGLSHAKPVGYLLLLIVLHLVLYGFIRGRFSA